MLCSIEEVNSRTDIDDLTVISGDYEAMYPSLEIDAVARIAAEEFLNSKLEVDIDWVELSLYLAVIFTRKELIDMGFGDFTHTRVTNSGRRPGVTTKEILERTGDTVSKFNLPVRKPNEDQQRKMFSVALEMLIKTAMNNHLFSFNGSLFKQRKGGAIGSTLTGSIAVLFTLRWYKDLKIKLEFATTEIPAFVLYMIKIYIDDSNILCETFPLGARLCSDGKIRVIQK